jgi:hypothetical protein
VTPEDEKFLADFEGCRFTEEQWHHREHIKVAYLYLVQYDFESAMNRMREKLKALNFVLKVPDLPTRGYHETITHAWMRLVQLTLSEYGPNDGAGKFYDQNPQLSQNKALRFFYSRELIMSPRAKAEFVEPDLAPLPRSCKKPLPRPD